MAQNQNEDFIAPRIVRGKVDSLSLFEITDYELELLEQGSPNAIYLNFAIFFVSIAISFLTALLTVEIKSQNIFTIFVVLTIVGFSIGGILIILWIKTRTKLSTLVSKIKARVPMATATDLPVTPEHKNNQECKTETNKIDLAGNKGAVI
jgi:hypothetical protein